MYGERDRFLNTKVLGELMKLVEPQTKERESEIGDRP